MVKCIRSSKKGWIKMPKRIPMPKEFVRKLNEHPYVLAATEWSIRFKPEFKQLAYNEYTHGKSMREIFQTAGFDVEMLGSGRLQNFRNSLVEMASSQSGFEDRRKNNCHKEAQSTEAQMAKRIRELEHLNAYLEQENEFLKKIQSVEMACSRKVDRLK